MKLPTEAAVRGSQTRWTALLWPGGLCVRAEAFPAPRAARDSQGSPGINQSGFQGAAHCPEPAVPVTELLPEPWTFLGLLGGSNVILLSLASVWEVMNSGVGVSLGEKFLRESS